jgi:hypothetical protein
MIALRQRPNGGGGLRGSPPVLAAPYVAAFGALNAYLCAGKDRFLSSSIGPHCS